MTKKKMARSRSSSSSAVATDTATYEMVIRSCKPRCLLNPSPWRLRSVGCLALSLFFTMLLFLARKTCRYAQYITLLVGGSKGVASPSVFHFFCLGRDVADMAPVRSHGTRKGCHYYTTLGAPLAVYSSDRA